MRNWRNTICLAVCLLGTAVSLAAQTPAVPSDRLGWNLTVSAGSSPLYTYAILVDGTRSALSNVTCEGDTELVCRTPLPAMTSGRHSVQVIAILAGVGESQPSEALVLTLVVVATPRGLFIEKGQ